MYYLICIILEEALEHFVDGFIEQIVFLVFSIDTLWLTDLWLSQL
jgi:hypothetical protein